MTAEHLKRHSLSYKYAIKGIFYAVKSQPNFWVHFFWTVTILLSGAYFGISKTEWLVLILTISVVLVAEMLNTGLEIVTDALKVHKKTEKDDFYIMVAKNVAAGAVLVAAGASVAIGLVIFGPRYWLLFSPFFS